MDLNFRELIPANFSDNSRVWVYQSDRAFANAEILQIKELLQNFTKKWKTHGARVEWYADIFFGYFIVLIADEQATGTEGFSIKSAIRLIKNIGRSFQVELFDRLMHAFIIGEKIRLLPLTAFNHSIEKNFITRDTLYFNNTILTKKELMNNWVIPVKESWLAIRIPENSETEAK